VQLRTELRGLQTNADGAGVASAKLGVQPFGEAPLSPVHSVLAALHMGVHKKKVNIKLHFIFELLHSTDLRALSRHNI
jgi:hypothetical protein